MGLKLAVILTFFILGALLWGVFWAAMYFMNVSGSIVMYGTFAFVGVMIFIQWLLGPIILKRLMKLKPCEDKKTLNMVYELADKAGVPRPTVFIADNPTPNAFAFGRTQKSACIALHSGLLEQLSEKEVRGVIAHELGHIRNRDMLVMTLASALPVLLYYIIYFGTIFASSRDNRGGGVNYLGAWLGGMVAQFLATLLVLYLSRTREYAADEHSARLTRQPDALASALAKISYSLGKTRVASPAPLRAFFIADPVEAVSSQYDVQMKVEQKRGFVEVFMTHPLTSKRIKALEQIKL